MGTVVQDFIPHEITGPHSLFAAYIKAIRRYGFETETFVVRNGAVYKKLPVAAFGVMKDDATETEVPAEDMQKGMNILRPAILRCS